MSEPEFRSDLFRGTASYYDRFRVPYPRSLINDLAERTVVPSSGRLLDLACGTGQLCFALHERFEQVWAVDSEPDMIAVVQAKAKAAGIANLRVLTCAAEDLPAPAQSFDLVTIGNAFHRLRRPAVAASVFRWLRPGGFLALVWGDPPWTGEAPWQRAGQAIAQRWSAQDRIPPGYGQDRAGRPDAVILAEAGLEFTGRREFTVQHEWTTEAIIGYSFSTSVLSRTALGDQAPAFEADLRRELLARDPSGRFGQTVTFARDLFRRPPGV